MASSTSTRAGTARRKAKPKPLPVCTPKQAKAQRVKAKRKRKPKPKCRIVPKTVVKAPAPALSPPGGTQPAALPGKPTAAAPAAGPKAAPKPAPKVAAPKVAAPKVVVVPELPAARPAAVAQAYSGEVYAGPFGAREAERLLWRAGFGPRPGDVAAVAALGLEGAVRSLTRPVGAAVLTGAKPTYSKAGVATPINPTGIVGHDHLHWLDRMIRTDQPLVERMALIWHDWFATSNDAVGQQKLLLDQTELFRARGLGNFEVLLQGVTMDPAMLAFLNGNHNRRGAINENFAREVMELFTLGADRGAYTEQDVRELARAFSGFRNDWTVELGNHNFRWDPARWDEKPKTVFGRRGAYAWEGACRLLVGHPLHPSFLVRKLWRAFITAEPSPATAQALETLYVDSGLELLPVLEAILMSPELYGDRLMVKPPVVQLAGMFRARRRTLVSDQWYHRCQDAGQRLYYPPDVNGWNDEAWMDTSTLRGRWVMVLQFLDTSQVVAVSDGYQAETPAQAVARAHQYWDSPRMGQDTLSALEAWSTGLINETRGYYRSQRQNALRQLIGTAPDYLTC